MRRRTILVACSVLSLAFGCAEIYGLGDYTEQEGGLDASDSGRGDVAADSPNETSTNDAGNDVTPPSDGGCAGACVPPIPGGWTAVAYDQAFRPNCASSYGTPTDVEEGLSASAASCGCACALTTPACSSLLVTSGDGGSNTCNNHSSQSLTWDGGACTPINAVAISNEKLSVTASGSGSCTPDASVVTPSVTYAYQGRMCELLSAPGGGCEAGVCVPPPTPYALCVHQAGVVACPSGYPVQHLIGTTPNDTRGCTPCTCGYDAGGGCGGSAVLYTGAGCSASSQTVTVDGTCQTVSNQTFKSLAYQPATSSAACTPSAVSPTGDAGFADPQTVCCTQ